MYGHPDTVSGWPCHTFICKFWHFQMVVSCLILGLCTPTMGIFVKLGLPFLTMWINSCLSHNLQTSTYSLTIWNLAMGADNSLVRKNLTVTASLSMQLLIFFLSFHDPARNKISISWTRRNVCHIKCVHYKTLIRLKFFGLILNSWLVLVLYGVASRYMQRSFKLSEFLPDLKELKSWWMCLQLISIFTVFLIILLKVLSSLDINGITETKFLRYIVT